MKCWFYGASEHSISLRGMGHPIIQAHGVTSFPPVLCYYGHRAFRGKLRFLELHYVRPLIAASSPLETLARTEAIVSLGFKSIPSGLRPDGTSRKSLGRDFRSFKRNFHATTPARRCYEL